MVLTLELDRRTTAARADLADAILRGRIEAPRYVTGVQRRVTASSAPLRREPRPDAALDTEALMGEAVTVYDEENGWAWGQLAADGYVGYLPSSALGASKPVPTHRIGALRSFTYPGPSLKLPPLDSMSFGAGVSVIGQTGEYAELAGGGFVFSGHLVGIDHREADFVAVAERFLHVPYLWGGKTSLGLDCSGLIQISLAAAGIAAPRDSDMQQAALGEPIAIRSDLGGLRRGDLIFWTGHMGVMLDGERLLHANSHHMAVAIELLAATESRIRRNSFGPIVAIRRL